MYKHGNAKCIKKHFITVLLLIINLILIFIKYDLLTLKVCITLIETLVKNSC